MPPLGSLLCFGFTVRIWHSRVAIRLSNLFSFNVFCLPPAYELLKGINYGLSTMATPPLLTPARGPFAGGTMAQNLATLFTTLVLYVTTAPQAKASQGEVRLELVWNYKSGGFTHSFRGGEDGFLAGSPENGQSLWGRKIPNGGASFSWQNKRHSNTVLVFI